MDSTCFIRRITSKSDPLTAFLSEPELRKLIAAIPTDNGVGLSAEKQRDFAEKPHYMNSMDDGLGLLIVRQIVEAHKGRLLIESAANQGCTAKPAFPRRASK